MTEKLSPIALNLLRYLAEHPDAEDTLEGIVECWLSKRLTKANAARVQAVLTQLVASGLLLDRCGKDKRTYYKINPRNLGKSQHCSTISRGL
ncbi:MAG TPA: hypothetical protein VNO50_03960 [Pyrinomonadaceae bacterium]|nr:hypothetical protein [Pyrinomonadaceae bacterium]